MSELKDKKIYECGHKVNLFIYIVFLILSGSDWKSGTLLDETTHGEIR